MNLNDFVVLPNKPKSVKLNTRNLRELRMETVQLAQESTIMESRLKQLRENMSREKEERERSGGMRWKSGQAGPLAAAPAARRNRENAAPKVPGAKVKIRVLKDEPLAEPRRPSRPGVGEQVSSRRPRLKGRACGQCEARAAGLVCPECGEDYCIGCFTRFHQKGALKLHRMIPIQAEVQTSVSALDVVRSFQRQVGTDAAELSSAPTGGRRNEAANWTFGEHSAPAVSYLVPPASHQARTASEEEEEEEDDEEEEEEMACAKGRVSPTGGSSLLRGHFDEEESARSFQRALRQWRGEAGDGAASPQQHTQACRPHSAALPVSVEAAGTQADLQPVSVRPIQVEFRQQGLCYMEKLLIKKHRRTPIEEYRALSSEASTQEPLTPSSTETDGESHRLTEEERELRRYLLSLFAVTPAGGAREPHCPAPPEPTLSIMELDQTVGDSVGASAFGVERRQVNTKGRESVSESRWKREEERRDVERRSAGSASASSSLPELRLSHGGQSSAPSHMQPAPPARPAPRPSPPSLGRPPAPSQLPPQPASMQSTPRGQLPARTSRRSRLSCSPKADKIKTPLEEDGRPAKSRLKQSPPKTPSPRSRLSSTPPGPSEFQSPDPQKPSKPPSPSRLTPSPSHLGSTKTGLTPSPPQPPSAGPFQIPLPLELLPSNPQKLSNAPSPRGRLTLSPCLGSSKDRLTPCPPHISSTGPVQSPSPSQLPSPGPLCTSSPPHLSRLGPKTPLEPLTPVSSVEISPVTLRTETTPRHRPRDSTSPQATTLLTPDVTSAPPPALTDSDCGPEEEEEEEEEEREEEEREEEEEEDWKGSVVLLLDQSDSSDEEIRGCVDELEAVSPLSPSPSPSPPLSPPAGPRGSCRSPEEEGAPLSPASVPNPDSHSSDSPLFTEPSAALQALAQRQSSQAQSFLGLDGFLTLGVEDGSERQGSAPVSARTHTPQPPCPHGASSLYSGGQLSWRPRSSLRESAPEELVMAVLKSQSPRSTHSRPASASHGRPTSATYSRPTSATYSRTASAIHSRRTPCSPRPTSASGRPLSRPVSRPLSRAAQEILEVQSVEQEVQMGEPEEEEEEEEEDRQALASLEEEFRRMSAQPGVSRDPGVGGSGAPPLVGHGTAGRAEGHHHSAGRSRSGSSMARHRTSSGHPDEEEENLRDKHSVLALP